MAVEVEGVKRPTGPPQGVDGGRSRTRHPWVMQSIYGWKKATNSCQEDGWNTQQEKQAKSWVTCDSKNWNKSKYSLSISQHFFNKNFQQKKKLLSSTLQTVVFNALSVFSLLLVATNPVALCLPPPSLHDNASLTQYVINQNFWQLNYSKHTEIWASYSFCDQQPLSQRQRQQLGLLSRL